MNLGSAQEMRLVQYLRGRGYLETIHGEEAVKKELGLPGLTCKCADVLGLCATKTPCRRVIVAESKGTDVASCIKQLGNAGAGVFEHFGAQLELRLLLYRSGLRRLPEGLSPGPGYLVKATPIPNLYHLLDASSHLISLARARCELSLPWIRWNSRLQQLVIEVYVE